MDVLFSSLAACKLLSKAGSYSTECSAVSRAPVRDLGEMGRGYGTGKQAVKYYTNPF